MPGDRPIFIYDEEQLRDANLDLLSFKEEFEEEEGNKLTGEKKKKVKKVKAKNAYFEPEASQFDLRGKKYLEDKVKKPSEESIFELLSFTIVRSYERPYHVAENFATLQRFLEENSDEFFLIVVRVVPAKPLITAVTVSRLRKGNSGLSETWEKYLNGDEAYKNERLKYIAKLNKAPSGVLALLRTLGGERPVILGKGYLKQQHYRGKNYYEVDVDAASSFVARQICNSVVKWSPYFKIAECFVVEAKTEEDLPERALYCSVLEHPDISKCCYAITAGDREFLIKNPFKQL